MMKYKWYKLLICICILQVSCEEFVDVDVPDHKIISETVFSNDKTANSAMIGIYNELFKAEFSNGGFRSVTMLGGLSADELQTTVLNNDLIDFAENEILINNSYNLNCWSSAYNIIYMCNSLIDGLLKHEGISSQAKDKLIGEAKFIRAFTYFYLINLYGNVPLITTPDYRQNAMAARKEITIVYKSIIEDLESSINMLGKYYENDEPLRVNKFTAIALLARVNLFLERWEKAETLSSQVINDGNYALLPNSNDIFLVNSKEAIWQISPAGAGEGSVANRTREAYTFIIMNPPPQSQTPVALTDTLITIFAPHDIRLTNWIGTFYTENQVYYYPLKYKKNDSKDEATEYSMVLRLAEQYLIRAEARAHMGSLKESIQDLDKIRERSNLNLISVISPGINKDALLDSIQLERRRELFTEWGHRWLDLKRTGKASEILSKKFGSWQDTDVLYPIPEEEINKNPNLTPNNDGY